MPPPDLVDVDGIAKMLDKPRRTVFRWIATPKLGFPPRYTGPYAAHVRKRVWRRQDVEAWARKTLPLPRGPRSQPPPS